MRSGKGCLEEGHGSNVSESELICQLKCPNSLLHTNCIQYELYTVLYNILNL